MKRCCTCKVAKPLDDFHRHARSADGRQARCRDCFRDQYARERVELKRKVHERMRRVRQDKDRSLAAYLVDHPCVDCGETDLRVLDFDHRDEGDKTRGVAQMLLGGWTWDATLVEIAKCDVRCANCHRKRTAERAGWRKHALQLEIEAGRAREREALAAQVAARLVSALGSSVQPEREAAPAPGVERFPGSGRSPSAGPTAPAAACAPSGAAPPRR